MLLNVCATKLLGAWGALLSNTLPQITKSKLIFSIDNDFQKIQIRLSSNLKDQLNKKT